METQEEVDTVVNSDNDLDCNSDEGDPNGWVLTYILGNFYLDAITDGTIYDKISKKTLPPLNSNGLLQLMHSMNAKNQLKFSRNTVERKEAMYFLFATKIENMMVLKDWNVIIQNFDTTNLINGCNGCGCIPCLWNTFGLCMIQLVHRYFDSTPTFRMSEEDKRYCRILICYLANRIRKGFPKYLYMTSTPRCVLEGIERFYPQDVRNEIPIPNFGFQMEDD